MKTKSNILKSYAQKVRQFRLEKGWSQEELAKRADLHRTYIGSIERYERNVSLLNIERIANALGVEIREFFN
jgi:transcriptional regulator with XRE-family HTH domain